MPTDSSDPAATAEAADRQSSWSWTVLDDESKPLWQLQWCHGDHYQRHCRFIEEIDPDIFGYRVQRVDDEAHRWCVEGGDAVALASVSWRSLPDIAMVGLFKSLGQSLRALHELRAPSGFGDPLAGQFYHTFNALMAAEFQALSQRLRALDDDTLHDRAVETMATLRHELSAFHPYGRSTWTAGQPTAQRWAVGRSPTQIEQFMDFGTAAIRPPEYDLAALSVNGLLGGHDLADRAFWKGYGAAVTCDLTRRIGYFKRLIELEYLLGAPPLLPPTNS